MTNHEKEEIILSTTDLTKLEWVIEAPDGGELEIEARHQRAGTVRQVVSLGVNP